MPVAFLFNPKWKGTNPFNLINPQRGGYKLDEKLDFIISILCTSVNVFILIHPLKINTN
jgi:hypothetical protein